LPGATANAVGRAVSADGSVVAGDAPDAGGVRRPLYWTEAVGVAPLPAPGTSAGYARGISADGSVIVGFDGGRSVRWTPGAAAVPLQDGARPSSNGPALAHGVSGDGMVAVGSAVSANLIVAFQAPATWDPTGALEEAGLNGTWLAASHDGSVVVGTVHSSAFFEGTIRRDSSGVISNLGVFPTGIGPKRHAAWAVSADGSVAVGIGRYSLDGRRITEAGAFVWDEVHGMRDLQRVLADLGVDTAGWNLATNLPTISPTLIPSGAVGISADGMTIIGNGVNPAGRPEAWMAVIPEPAALGGLTFAAFILTRRRSRPALRCCSGAQQGAMLPLPCPRDDGRHARGGGEFAHLRLLARRNGRLGRNSHRRGVVHLRERTETCVERPLERSHWGNGCGGSAAGG
jgi:hypothetical protein